MAGRECCIKRMNNARSIKRLHRYVVMIIIVFIYYARIHFFRTDLELRFLLETMISWFMPISLILISYSYFV